MQKKLFGTDGVRGKVYKELNPEMAYKLGIAINMIISSLWEEPYSSNSISNSEFIIGGDTRLSTPSLSSALASGLTLVGGKVYEIGIAPTPAVALLSSVLSEKGRKVWGISVSASHNPPEYNGIKLMDMGGIKASDNLERKIENLFFQIEKLSTHEIMEKFTIDQNSPEKSFLANWEEIYIESLKNSSWLRNFPANPPEVTLDTGYGATYHLAPLVFQAFGVKTIPLNAEPDGRKINLNCGATYPNFIRENAQTPLGFSFDGDGDRVIGVIKGKIIDGDDIIYLISRYLREKGVNHGEIVVTVMTNLGVEKKIKELGFNVHRVTVGDKYVQERLLQREEALLGGEQSGHIILKGLNKTGDGIATALVLTKITAELGEDTLINWLEEIVKYPQILINIPLKAMGKWNEEHNRPIIEKLNEELKGKGRLPQ